MKLSTKLKYIINSKAYVLELFPSGAIAFSNHNFACITNPEGKIVHKYYVGMGKPPSGLTSIYTFWNGNESTLHFGQYSAVITDDIYRYVTRDWIIPYIVDLPIVTFKRGEILFTVNFSNGHIEKTPHVSPVTREVLFGDNMVTLYYGKYIIQTLKSEHSETYNWIMVLEVDLVTRVTEIEEFDRLVQNMLRNIECLSPGDDN